MGMGMFTGGRASRGTSIILHQVISCLALSVLGARDRMGTGRGNGASGYCSRAQGWGSRSRSGFDTGGRDGMGMPPAWEAEM